MVITIRAATFVVENDGGGEDARLDNRELKYLDVTF